MRKLCTIALMGLSVLLFGYSSGRAVEKITLIVPLPQLTSVFAFASSIPTELRFL